MHFTCISIVLLAAVSFSRASIKKDDALRHLETLEKRLDALGNESQDTLDCAKVEAQEREDKRLAKLTEAEGKLVDQL
jgi:hypothetical protein